MSVAKLVGPALTTIIRGRAKKKNSWNRVNPRNYDRLQLLRSETRKTHIDTSNKPFIKGLQSPIKL